MLTLVLVQSSCGISCLHNFNRYKRYNAHELVEGQSHEERLELKRQQEKESNDAQNDEK